MRKQVLSHISGTNENWYLVYGKKFGNISPSKLHMHLLFNSAILLLKIYVKDRLEKYGKINAQGFLLQHYSL